MSAIACTSCQERNYFIKLWLKIITIIVENAIQKSAIWWRSEGKVANDSSHVMACHVMAREQPVLSRLAERATTGTPYIPLVSNGIAIILHHFLLLLYFN